MRKKNKIVAEMSEFENCVHLVFFIQNFVDICVCLNGIFGRRTDGGVLIASPQSKISSRKNIQCWLAKDLYWRKCKVDLVEKTPCSLCIRLLFLWVHVCIYIYIFFFCVLFYFLWEIGNGLLKWIEQFQGWFSKLNTHLHVSRWWPQLAKSIRAWVFSFHSLKYLSMMPCGIRLDLFPFVLLLCLDGCVFFPSISLSLSLSHSLTHSLTLSLLVVLLFFLPCFISIYYLYSTNKWSGS